MKIDDDGNDNVIIIIQRTQRMENAMTINTKSEIYFLLNSNKQHIKNANRMKAKGKDGRRFLAKGGKATERIKVLVRENLNSGIEFIGNDRFQMDDTVFMIKEIAFYESDYDCFNKARV